MEKESQKVAVLYILESSNGICKIGYSTTGTTNILLDFDTYYAVRSVITVGDPVVARDWVAALKKRFGIYGSMYDPSELVDYVPQSGFLKVAKPKKKETEKDRANKWKKRFTKKAFG